MNFDFSEDQLALRDLAREILEKEVTLERLKEIDATPAWFDRKLWQTLAQANLLGIGVPEVHGGAGLGVVELGLLLQELGRVLAPVPALPTLVLAGMPIASFGTDAQRERWLPAITRGEAVLTTALVDAAGGDAARPGTQARREGDGWVLEGRKVAVPAAQIAERVLVPAATEEGVGVFLVDPRASGVVFTQGRVSTGEPYCSLELAGVAVPGEELLGADPTGGGRTAAWIHDRALVATCCLHLGVCERALEITAAYVTEREQFGVPVGTFQAVQHRAADAYIDLECMRWTTWRAGWRLDEGLSALREAAVAKFWASEGGARIAATAQHLHAGIGVDRDYPIHRYFLWSKQLELALGATTPELLRLGRDLARTGPTETP
jgi:alkylation response protein AidB-like acyl-CoA dehydrogenase